MRRKLIRIFGAFVCFLTSLIPESHAIEGATEVCGADVLYGNTYLKLCNTMVSLHSCWLYDGSQTYHGDGYIQTPCNGYRNETGIACWTSKVDLVSAYSGSGASSGTGFDWSSVTGNDKYTAATCASVFGAGYTPYDNFREVFIGSRYIFSQCRDGSYLNSGHTCVSGECDTLGMEYYDGWCQPCSGFRLDGNGNEETYVSTGYGNSNGVYSWFGSSTVIGIHTCRGYVANGTTFSGQYGTFTLEGGCPYVE